jgi:hypothetical protein
MWRNTMYGKKQLQIAALSASLIGTIGFGGCGSRHVKEDPKLSYSSSFAKLKPEEKQAFREAVPELTSPTEITCQTQDHYFGKVFLSQTLKCVIEDENPRIAVVLEQDGLGYRGKSDHTCITKRVIENNEESSMRICRTESHFGEPRYDMFAASRDTQDYVKPADLDQSPGATQKVADRHHTLDTALAPMRAHGTYLPNAPVDNKVDEMLQKYR